MKKMIINIITWYVNVPKFGRLTLDAIIAFLLFHAILIGLQLLGGLLTIALGDISKANLVLGRVGMIIEFPVLLIYRLIGGILYFIPCIDHSGENPVMFTIAIILFYTYNISLIVGCLEIIRRIYMSLCQSVPI